MTDLDKIKAALQVAAEARAAGKPVGHDRPDLLATISISDFLPAPAFDRKAEGRRRWAEMLDRADSPVVDVPAEIEWLKTRAVGMGDCSCDTHWQEELKLDPPEVSSPPAYIAWIVRRRAAVAKRIGKPVAQVQ